MTGLEIGAIIAATQLAISAYGAWKGQQAAEEAAEAEAERRANLKRLAIAKFKNQQGTSLWNLSQLSRQESRQGDIEKDILLFKTIEQKKMEGKVLAHGGMEGKSSDFMRDRMTGDLLRGKDALKTDFKFKKIGLHSQKESVVRGLATARINMEYGIAGLTPPSSSDSSLMWLQMGNAALDAYGTYHKYTKPRANPDLSGTTDGFNYPSAYDSGTGRTGMR